MPSNNQKSVNNLFAKMGLENIFSKEQFDAQVARLESYIAKHPNDTTAQSAAALKKEDAKPVKKPRS